MSSLLTSRRLPGRRRWPRQEDPKSREGVGAALAIIHASRAPHPRFKNISVKAIQMQCRHLTLEKGGKPATVLPLTGRHHHPYCAVFCRSLFVRVCLLVQHYSAHAKSCLQNPLKLCHAHVSTSIDLPLNPHVKRFDGYCKSVMNVFVF